MGVSQKYRTFTQLMEDVSIDFSTYALEGMIEPQQLIKVATRVNYDLGLKIHRTKEVIIDDVPYIPAPGEVAPCTDGVACKDVCVIETCDGKNSHQIVQRIGPNQFRTFSTFMQLRIQDVNSKTCFCPTLGAQAADIAEIVDGFLVTSFRTGKVYLSYQGAMEAPNGDLLVLDQPYCNEYYEYAIKQRILENMIWQGENVSQQMNLVETRLRAARNNALSFVNTPDFAEMRKLWEVNRRAQYHNYYNMFLSHPPVNPRVSSSSMTRGNNIA